MSKKKLKEKNEITDSVVINALVRDAAIRSGMFYKHMDGSLCCTKCNKTVGEGCKHGKITITVCR